MLRRSYTNAFHSFCREFAGGTLTMTTHVNIIGYTQYWERNVNLVLPTGCKANRGRLGYHDRSKIRNLHGLTHIDKRKWLYITQPKILRSADKWPVSDSSKDLFFNYRTIMIRYWSNMSVVIATFLLGRFSVIYAVQHELFFLTIILPRNLMVMPFLRIDICYWR